MDHAATTTTTTTVAVAVAAPDLSGTPRSRRPTAKLLEYDAHQAIVDDLQDAAAATARPPPPKRKRSSSTKPSRTEESTDDIPKRITNPLVEEGNKPLIQDLLLLTDGVDFHAPDTFPIAYYARILGLESILDDLMIDTTGIVSQQQLLDRLGNLAMRTTPCLESILPQRGTTPRNLLFWQTGDGEDDDVKLMMEDATQFDPLYCFLLMGKAQTIAVSEAQHTEILQIPRAPTGKDATEASVRTRPPVPAQTAQVLQAVLDVFSPVSDSLAGYSFSPLESEQAPQDPSRSRSRVSGWLARSRGADAVKYRIVFSLEWGGSTSSSTTGKPPATAAPQQQQQLLVRITELSDTAPVAIRVVLVALVLQQRLSNYARLFPVAAAASIAPHFRLARHATNDESPWVCDATKCSLRHAVLLLEQQSSKDPLPQQTTGSRRRWLVRMPTGAASTLRLAGHPTQSSSQAVVRYDVSTSSLIQGSATAVDPKTAQQPMDILRDFELAGAPSCIAGDDEDAVTQELIRRQTALHAIEMNEIVPAARQLLSRAIQEKSSWEYDNPLQQRQEEQRIQEACVALIQRKQAPITTIQDMEAECCICADGEVTPDNQILFCEACNVAVHQFCYGIEQIPNGDYYCMPCRDLGRHLQPSTAEARRLPLNCELCPLRDGAFVRADVKGQEGDRWVHVVCAKWMGLRYSNETFSAVEDPSELKMDILRLGIRCELCLSDRGGMLPCSGALNCKKYFHVTCARAVGNMKVVHGEDCAGPIKGGWSLFCPSHSGKGATRPKKRKRFSVDQLVEAARRFPPEPRPPPRRRPFGQVRGPDRKALLALPDYENQLLTEILSKRYYGVACEICDEIDDEGSHARCKVCRAAFCFSCRTNNEKIVKGSFQCRGCAHASTSTEEEAASPQCLACFEKGGILLPSFAEPRTKKKFWKDNPEQTSDTLFGKKQWIHTLCARYVLLAPMLPILTVVGYLKGG